MTPTLNTPSPPVFCGKIRERHTPHLNPSTYSVVGPFSLAGALTQPGWSPQPNSRIPAETAWHPSSKQPFLPLCPCKASHLQLAEPGCPAGCRLRTCCPPVAASSIFSATSHLFFHRIPCAECCSGSELWGPSNHSRQGPPGAGLTFTALFGNVPGAADRMSFLSSPGCC